MVERHLVVQGCRRRLTYHLPWVMLGIRATFPDDSEFSPAEPVLGLKLVLLGLFVNTDEWLSPSFLDDLQTAMAGCSPPLTRDNLAPAPTSLPKELLLARFVLVCRVGVQLPVLAPAYDGPYCVLQRSTHFFLLQIGER